MATDDEDNPYASPVAVPDEARRRTRWRIIPVTLFALYGLICLVSTPILLLVAFNRPVEYGGGISATLILGIGLNFGGSILWIATAALCWIGRWRWMTLARIVAYAATAIGWKILGSLGFN